MICGYPFHPLVIGLVYILEATLLHYIQTSKPSNFSIVFENITKNYENNSTIQLYKYHFRLFFEYSLIQIIGYQLSSIRLFL